jgi:hypothetical protein
MDVTYIIKLIKLNNIMCGGGNTISLSKCKKKRKKYIRKLEKTINDNEYLFKENTELKYQLNMSMRQLNILSIYVQKLQSTSSHTANDNIHKQYSDQLINVYNFIRHMNTLNIV